MLRRMRARRTFACLIHGLALLAASGCVTRVMGSRYTRVRVVQPEKGPFVPFDTPFAEGAPARAAVNAASTSVFDVEYALWRDVISHNDGPRCGHYPTCSQFAFEDLKAHGVPALYHTTSRFYSEYGDLHAYGFYELRIQNGVGRLYDPVESYQSLATETVAPAWGGVPDGLPFDD